jgi:hypothetical protein
MQLPYVCINAAHGAALGVPCRSRARPPDDTGVCLLQDGLHAAMEAKARSERQRVRDMEHAHAFASAALDRFCKRMPSWLEAGEKPLPDEVCTMASVIPCSPHPSPCHPTLHRDVRDSESPWQESKGNAVRASVACT